MPVLKIREIGHTSLQKFGRGGREARVVILVVAVVVVVWCQFHPPLKVFPFLPAILFG